MARKPKRAWMPTIVLAAPLIALLLATLPGHSAEYEAIGLPASAPRRMYPEPRLYVQSQSWWRPAADDPGDHDDHEHLHVGEHVHVEAALPLGQTVRGTIYCDVRIQLHDQPAGSVVNLLRVIDDKKMQLVARKLAIKPDEHGSADVWIRDIPIHTKMQMDGRREYRFTANVSTRADGKRQYQSSGWLWTVDNAPDDTAAGKPVDYRTAEWIEARGWYTGFGYANARLLAKPPYQPIAGLWKPRVAMVAGSDGAPVTSHSAHLDPDFHAGSPGTILREADGPFTGLLPIDTAGLKLSNGVHKLVLISHQKAADGGRNSGVLVVPFVVGN